MIRKHTEFPLPLDPPGKLDKQAIHCPTDNFGPLSRGQRHWSDVDHCVWYLFDLKVTRSLGLIQKASNSKCSVLTYFSMSLAHKYINLKDPYLQDPRDSVQKVFFKFNPLFVELTFQIIYLTRPLKPFSH